MGNEHAKVPSSFELERSLDNFDFLEFNKLFMLYIRLCGKLYPMTREDIWFLYEDERGLPFLMFLHNFNFKDRTVNNLIKGYFK